MTNGWEDYYEILQVHFMAEPDIIKNSYIKLSKKYHPDVNKSEDAKNVMQKINRAYDTLRDPVLRAQYMVKWMDKYSLIGSSQNNRKRIHQLDFAVVPCKNVLLNYLSLLSQKKYAKAFQLLSNRDKQALTKNDFIKWQSLVSEIFVLNNFECTLKNIYKNVYDDDKNFFEIIVQLEVSSTEKNLIMDRTEQDTFCKNIIYEENSWRVFLGHKDIKSFINKFNQLVTLKKSKNKTNIGIIEKLMINLTEKLDNKSEFIKIGEKEQIRHNRYGNKFSIIQCTIFNNQKDLIFKKNDIYEISEIVEANIRNLDTLCRWNDTMFLLLLVETDAKGASTVAHKLNWILKKNFKTYEFKFNVKEQKYDSFKSLIDSLSK
ncbi:DnaJ domain-containing protein [Clostridium sp. DL1XJH146]